MFIARHAAMSMADEPDRPANFAFGGQPLECDECTATLDYPLREYRIVRAPARALRVPFFFILLSLKCGALKVRLHALSSQRAICESKNSGDLERNHLTE
jgi:hypothetical protein